MRLYCISFSLLLYANLAHATGDPPKLVDVHTGDPSVLADIPEKIVNNLKCSDANIQYVDVSERLRTGDVCKKANLAKRPFLAAFVDVSTGAPVDNKPYLCCLNIAAVCPGGYPLEKDGDGHVSCATAFQDCSRNMFCLRESFTAKDAEYQKETDAAKSALWEDLDICCPTVAGGDQTCKTAGATFKSSPDDFKACVTNKGRCKPADKTVCGRRANDPRENACCEIPDTDMCPGGFLPYGFKAAATTIKGTQSPDDEAVTDWNLDSVEGSFKEPWKNACTALGDKLTHLHNGKVCCPKAKLSQTTPLDPTLLESTYGHLSDKSCAADGDCDPDSFCAGVVSAVDNNEQGTGKACFKKLQCPHKDKAKIIWPTLSTSGQFACSTSADCADPNAICVWGAKHPDATKQISLCCDKTAYEPECTAALAGSPHITQPGQINAKLAKCTSDATTRILVPVLTGATDSTEEKTHVCCEYGTVTVGTNTCEALAGNKKATGVPLVDSNNRPIQCGKPEDPLYRAPCAKKGYCFDDPKSGNGICCDTELCPDGHTPLKDVVPFNDPNCMWSNPVFNPTKAKKYSIKDKKGVDRCCPPKVIKKDGEWSWDTKEVPASFQSVKVHPPWPCKDSKECGGYGKYCDDVDKHCYILGGPDSYNLGNKAAGNEFCMKTSTGADCVSPLFNGYIWNCAYRGPISGDATCITQTRVTNHPPKQLNQALLYGCFGCGAVSLISGIFAVVFFLMYRSRNFCDKRKKDWNKKNKKSKKGGDTTTTGGGGTTTGGGDTTTR